MATRPPLPSARPATSGKSDAPFDRGAEKAIFTLLEPIKTVLNGVETDLHGMAMRALATADLELLDQFRGQPIALTRHAVAALCDLTPDQVRQLHLEDFTMLASDALFQIEQVSISLGLAPDYFLQSPMSGEAV